MTFKQIILRYLRSWLETAGRIAEVGIVAHYTALAQASPWASPISVIAAKYLYIVLCENRGLHNLVTNQVTCCVGGWGGSAQQPFRVVLQMVVFVPKGRLSSAPRCLLTFRLTRKWEMLDALPVLSTTERCVFGCQTFVTLHYP